MHSWAVPALVAEAEPDATRRFLESSAATIRNPNTRTACARALRRFFGWCEDRGIHGLDQIEPMVVAAYIEQHPGAAPTVKQHLSAIRMCFDWRLTGQVVRQNPATSVKSPKHIVTRGKTPVLAADDARQLLDSIETDTIVGLRDRALIGLMVYSFARVGAAVGMSVEDCYRAKKRWWFRLHKNGGKNHAVPAPHNTSRPPGLRRPHDESRLEEVRALRAQELLHTQSRLTVWIAEQGTSPVAAWG